MTLTNDCEVCGGTSPRGTVRACPSCTYPQVPHGDRDRSEDPRPEREEEADQGAHGNQRGPKGYRCCRHCTEDAVHDVDPDEHDGPCSICDDPAGLLRERAERAEARSDKAESVLAELRGMARAAELVPVHVGGGNLVRRERMLRAVDVLAALPAED